MRPTPSTAPHEPPDTGSAGDPGVEGPRRVPLAWHALVLLPLLLHFWTGQRGIDFGHHWDESIQVENLQRAIDTQTLLPKWYRYPSVLFWMSLGSLAPEILADLPGDGEEMEAAQARLSRTAGKPSFRLRLRTVFLATTCLALLWTYAAAFAWRRNVFEAFLAASLLGLSWELAYHARWVAPDGILVQFGALTLLLATLAVRRRDTRWLWAAAAAAGLGCGTKYTGGILLLPVMVAAFQLRDAREPLVRTAFRMALTVGPFLLAFLLSTPGAALQPFVFFRHVGFEIEHYRTGHYGATIDAGLPHLLAIVRYLGAHLFSQQAPLALAVSALAGVGLVSTWRRSPGRALLLAGLPLVYVLYMSTQRVMFVRNLLLVAPFLALLAARGALACVESLRARAPGGHAAVAAAALAIGLPWAVQAPFLVRSSQSIRERDVDEDVRRAHAWLGAHAEQSVFVSGRVARSLRELDLALPSNATRDRTAPVDAALFFPAEIRSNVQLVANRPGTSLAVFGPLDVNFAYYPAWPNPKVVAYPAEAAREAGLIGGE